MPLHRAARFVSRATIWRAAVLDCRATVHLRQSFVPHALPAALSSVRWASVPPPRSARTFYEVLGVSQNATKKEIKTKFYELSMKCHPDRNQNDESAHALFLAINEAYSVLGDEVKRKNYDSELSTATSSSSANRANRNYYANMRRQRIRPDDWIQYKKMAEDNRPRYNYKEHADAHYGPAERGRFEKKFSILSRRASFQAMERDKHITVIAIIGLLIVFLVEYFVVYYFY